MHQLTAVLLDRDGTVIVDKHYLSDPSGVELYPDAAKALSRLGRGVGLYVVTNQSAIGRGYTKEQMVQACNARLEELLLADGVRIAQTIYCPHAPEEACACRKPGTGMWEQLRAAHGLKAEATAMLGDKRVDMQFAANAGFAARVLVETGKGRKEADALGLGPVDEATGYSLYPQPASPEHPHVLAKDLNSGVSGLLALLQTRNAGKELA